MTASPARSKFSIIWNILKIFLALLLVGFVLSRTDLSQFPALLDRISTPGLSFYIILFLLLTLLKAFQYYTLIGGSVSYAQVLNVVVLQNALTNYLASTAGIVSYLGLLRAEYGVKVSRSVVIFLLIKVCDLIIIWLALFASSLMVWQTIDVFHNLILAVLSGIGLVILVFFLTVMFRQKFLALLKNILEGLRLSQISLIQKGINILEALAGMEQDRFVRTMGTAFLLSAVYFVISTFLVYTSFLVFDFPQNFQVVVFVSVLLQLISYIPIQVFGGLGVTETSALYFWSPFSVPQTELASVLIGIRILFFLVNLLPLIYLPLYTVFFANKTKYQND